MRHEMVMCLATTPPHLDAHSWLTSCLHPGTFAVSSALCTSIYNFMVTQFHDLSSGHITYLVQTSLTVSMCLWLGMFIWAVAGSS